MRILIDLQGAQGLSKLRGVGRYSLSISLAIAKEPMGHEVHIALNGVFLESTSEISSLFKKILPENRVHIWDGMSDVTGSNPKNLWRRKCSEAIRETFFISLCPDVVFVPSFFDGFGDDAVQTCSKHFKTVALVHDLIPLISSSEYLKKDPQYSHFYMRQLEDVQKSNLLLSNSESTKNEIIQFTNYTEGNIYNIGAAASDNFQLQQINLEKQQAFKEKFGISKPFILYVGASDERKNLKKLLEAYAKLPSGTKKRHQLVFMGAIPAEHKNKFSLFAKELNLNKSDFLVFNHLSDDDLVIAYHLCKLFVFPSLHEGFGLPALEAMTCGAPTIASNLTSLPEVVKNPQALFNPQSTPEITEKINLVLTDDKFRKQLINTGKKQAAHFSWKKSAHKAITAIEKRIQDGIAKENQLSPSELKRNLLNNIANIIPKNISSQALAEISWHACRAVPRDEEKNIYIDVSELIQRDAKTGIQRVVKSIVKHLSSSEKNIIPVYIGKNSTCYISSSNCMNKILNHEAINSEKDDQIIDFHPGDIFLGLDFCPTLIPEKRQILLNLKNHGVKIYFVVYDLLPILLPKLFPKGSEKAHELWLKTISNFDGAFCISKSVSKELEAWQKDNKIYSPDFKIGWFHLGADIDTEKLPLTETAEKTTEALECLSTSINFLMLGTIEPRKGHIQTLHAFEMLWKEGIDINLVIVGKQGWLVDNFISKLKNHPTLNKKLFWLKDLDDKSLEKIYKVSTCLLAASEGEGFGLPLIESAQHKLPIVARDIPVFREVAGEHAYYFKDTTHSEAISLSIKKWLALYQDNKHPTSNKMPWLVWKESTKNLFQLLDI
jgi:glycosyltransferase involved in cell wall biosynthesis